jgi:hypothetical protein
MYLKNWCVCCTQYRMRHQWFRTLNNIWSSLSKQYWFLENKNKNFGFPKRVGEFIVYHFSKSFVCSCDDWVLLADCSECKIMPLSCSCLKCNLLLLVETWLENKQTFIMLLVTGWGSLVLLVDPYTKGIPLYRIPNYHMPVKNSLLPRINVAEVRSMSPSPRTFSTYSYPAHVPCVSFFQ